VNERSSDPRDVVVVGVSAGGVQALTALRSALPPDLDAAIAITMHRSPSQSSVLVSVVARKSAIPVIDAVDGQPFERRRLYVAPPDRHLLFSGDRIWLDRGAKHHHTRPAVDPMFASAAENYDRRVIGVLLTGHLSDGVAGLVEIKRAGGLSIVQDPQEAVAPSMPRNALRHDHVDLVFKLDALAALLGVLVTGRSPAAAMQTPGVREPSPEELGTDSP
jgi:two-component system, chemotaxis family, protein-glutamate methylesterase/glutaminase